MQITVNQKWAEALKLLLDTYLKANGIDWKHNVDLIINAINVADDTLLEWDKEVEQAEQDTQPETNTENIWNTGDTEGTQETENI